MCLKLNFIAKAISVRKCNLYVSLAQSMMLSKLNCWKKTMNIFKTLNLVMFYANPTTSFFMRTDCFLPMSV